MFAVAFDAGEADAGQFGCFGYREASFERFPHFAQILGIEPFGPADVLALGGGQLLAGFGLLQNALAVVLGQRGEDGEHEFARRRGRVDAQVQGLEVDAALMEGIDQVNHVVAAATQAEEARHQHRVPRAQQPQQLIERRPLQAHAGDFVLKDAVAPGLGEDVELGVQVLVNGRDAGVAEGLVHKGEKGSTSLVHKGKPPFIFGLTFWPLFSGGSLPGEGQGGQGQEAMAF
jgi:hypothetical protein